VLWSGAVCTWSIFNREFNPAVPDLVLDHTICIMCLRFHPTSPSLVAAGSFNGEVLVWDLNHSDSPIAISPIAEAGHSEPVMAVDWVRDPSSDRFLLGSVGADGKVGRLCTEPAASTVFLAGCVLTCVCVYSFCCGVWSRDSPSPGVGLC
jgi:WD40 repeat protein